MKRAVSADLLRHGTTRKLPKHQRKEGKMSLGDDIRSLYQKFVLRDLFSFISPGAIFVVSALYFYGWTMDRILTVSKETPFVLYLPIFGAFYAVGLALQGIGAALNLAPLHNRRNAGDRRDYREHVRVLREFMEATRDREDAREQHERFVVLKQMSGNSALSVLLSGALFSIKYLLTEWLWWIPLCGSLLIGILLLNARRRQLEQQEKWEDLTIEIYRTGSDN